MRVEIHYSKSDPLLETEEAMEFINNLYYFAKVALRGVQVSIFKDGVSQPILGERRKQNGK